MNSRGIDQPDLLRHFSSGSMTIRRRRTALTVFTLLFALGLSDAATAQTIESPPFLRRITVEAHYQLSEVSGQWYQSVYARNSTTGRETTAFMRVRYRSISHGMGIDVALIIKPWISVGLDGHLQRDFSAPTHPWFQSLGVRYGQRDAFIVGAFAEFRPWQRDYQPRRGWFFRGGARELWFDRHLSRDQNVITPTNGQGRDIQAWLGGGYRLNLLSAMSMHIACDLAGGIDSFEGLLRIGGGYR